MTEKTKKIKNKTLKKSFLTWFFWHGCSQQAESMLGLAFAQSMAPVIDDLYETKEERSEALKRHITLFNTEPQVGSICNGIICGLEEANANGEATPELINSVKIALIGPTSAIGDSLWVATIIPILLTIALSLSQSSEALFWLGPVLYIVFYPIITFLISRWLFYLGYKSGLEGMQTMMSSGKLNNLTNAMSLLGLIVTGALTASFVNASLPIQILKDVLDPETGEIIKDSVIFDANAMLDGIFPKLLPFLLTLLVYTLYTKKKWSPLKIMALIFVLASIQTFIGFQFGIY